MTDEPSITPEQEQDRALVKAWTSRIKEAKEHWQKDFDRMRENMEFVAGIQWPGQCTIDDDRYVANITHQLIKNKVATLYAKNPTAVFERRERMDFILWDESEESLLEAINQAQVFLQSGLPLPPELANFFKDIEAGKLHRKVVERVGRTLQILYKYATDSQKPEFKQQAKAAVRRAATNGVAYGRPVLCVEGADYEKPSSIDHRSGATERAKRASVVLNKAQEGELDSTSAELGNLRSLALSLGAGESDSQFKERLEFDFHKSTKVIPDKRCSSLIDFVGGRFVAVEYILPVDDVNAIFQTNIKVGGEGNAIEAGNESGETPSNLSPNANLTQTDSAQTLESKLCYLYEVFDYTTKTRFFIVEGWKDYVSPPEVPFPMVSGFYPLYGLMFNEVESEPGTKTSIFPPSDVQKAKSAQLEWNRSRDALRHQRNANSPVWMYRDGLLTEDDKDKLRNAEPNSAIALKGVPPEMTMEQFFARRPAAEIDPAMYDTAPLEQDLMLAAGTQQANMGPAQPNVTATVGTIAEQSRMDVSASDVDELDGWLSRLAQAGGEMMLQGFSIETVKAMAGPGAVWPTSPETIQNYRNEVFLRVEAASSGRPNKAVDIANWRDLAPLMQQAGANPLGLIKKTAKVLDENLDITDFFPLLPPKGSIDAMGGGTPSESQQGSSAPPALPSSPMPLPAMAGGNDGGMASEQPAPVY